MSEECLLNKSYSACQDDIPSLEEKNVKKLLKQLENGWTINDAGHLYKEYFFSDFRGPMVFANRVAKIAEKEAHHSDTRIAWGACAVEIGTHKIKGLTESDFIFAAKVDEIK